MNSAIKKFNKTIEAYLLDDTQGNFSKTIELISSLYPDTKNYNYIFDSFTEKIGMKMVIMPVHSAEKERETGYKAKFQYLEGNVFNERPGYITLIDKYFTFDDAHAYIAKEALYKISSLINLDEIIHKMR